MSEEDVRDGLRGAVAAEPPQSFDPDALMDAGQRQVKRRRALVSVGLATVLVAVAVPVAVGIARGTDGVTVGTQPGAPGISEPPPTSAAPEPGDIPWPPPGVTPVSYTAAELAQRGEDMRAHLLATFATVVPGVSGVDVQPFGGEATGTVSEGQSYLNAFTTFAVAGVPHAVDVQVIAPGGESMTPEERCGHLSPDACEARELADGSWLLIVDESEGQSQIVSVLHYRDTGAVVRATGYNYDPTSQTAVKYSQTVPVAVDQLAALATDTRLGL